MKPVFQKKMWTLRAMKEQALKGKALLAGAALVLGAGAWLAVAPTASGKAETRRIEVAKPELWQGTLAAGASELLVSVPALEKLQPGAAVNVRIEWDGKTVEKALHEGDPDFLQVLSVAASGPVKVALEPRGTKGSIPVEIRTAPLGPSATPAAQLAVAGHGTWRTALPMELGRSVYATNDDRPYVPSGSKPEEVFRQMLDGVHWYTFTHSGGERLVHFNVDIVDRDVPLDVALFVEKDGKLEEYTRGRERYETEKSTILHGTNKFIPRVISPGKYYVRVMGNHPYYRLETTVYGVPPYSDPQQAVRVAMDYLVRRGDSWHANVPRKGYVALRATQQLQETRLCIACHPTHFTTRAEMVAVENGYSVKARSSLQFLVERLYNNPRPIYGRTDASWARMIHAPGNVLTRLAYIVDKYERNLSHDRRDELYRGIGAFMEMYWQKMSGPQPESNGNLPRISGYEVAHHSGVLFGELYRRTNDPKWKALRETTEKVAQAGEPADLLDVAWRLVALVELGEGKRYQAEIDALVKEIFSHQRADGSWAMPFGLEVVEYDWSSHQVKRKKLPPSEGQEGPRRSDFQTYHNIYALAKAGVGLDDPRMKKAVEFCLRRQTESGAWQGTPEYKNFDTPFRDTQYAVMALSSMYPGEKGKGGVKGWNDGFAAPPKSFQGMNAVAKIAALDAHWDRPAEATVQEIRGLLKDPSAFVRFQAALALGRFADAASAEALGVALGDGSKMVQRSAAWALRQIGSRRAADRDRVAQVLLARLESPDSRVRWGATRVFNQHFKYLADDWRFGTALEKLSVKDPVPVVRVAALQSLYQWFFWDPNTEHKAEIEKTLIAGLGDTSHPWVRRNAIEAYYNVLEDNLRYLYGSWMPRVKLDSDREDIKKGHRAHVRAQAQRYRDAMLAGDEATREGLLRALNSHVLRQGLSVDVAGLKNVQPPETLAGPWLNGYRWFALYDPLKDSSGERASIGNDSDPPLFYEDSAPLMNEAFRAALDSGSENLIRNTVRALTVLKPFAINPDVAEKLLALSESGPARTEVAQAAQSLLPGAKIASPAVTARLENMIRTGDAEALRVAAAVLRGDQTGALDHNEGVTGALVARLQAANPDDALFAPLVEALSAVPAAQKREPLVAKAMSGATSQRKESREAALRLAYESPAILQLAGASENYNRLVKQGSDSALVEGLAFAGSLNYAKGAFKEAMPEIRRLVAAGLSHSSSQVRAAAVSALRTIEPLKSDQELLAKLNALGNDRDATVRNAARTLEASLAAQSGAEGFSASQLLDYEYFRFYVEPLLVKKGKDGLACANCHANHNIFKLIEPDQFGVLNLQDSRANYSSALKVVNVSKPESSLILNKPISDLDDEGIGNSREFSHGGGLRWPDRKDSREYQVILKWLHGERLDTEVTAGGGQ